MLMYIRTICLINEKMLNVTKFSFITYQVSLRLANYCFLFGFIIIDYLPSSYKTSKNEAHEKKKKQ